MKIPKIQIAKHAVPILALIIIAFHFMLASTTNLSPWKGGGFGMYAEVHYYFNDLVISDLNKPLDSIIKEDRSVAQFVMDVKRSPNHSNLKRIAELVSNYSTNDTINVQLWKPLIDSKNSTYTRELVNQYQFIKP